jgi:carbamate kinase
MMRIVIALGGNALLRRSDPMTTEVQRRNIAIAARAIAPLTAEHGIVIVHGNGPQVGLLSLQADSYQGAEPYPLDVLDAGTQGMIGYLIQQEMRSLLADRQVATLLTMVVVDPQDPAFANPTKFVGPVYTKEAADALAAEKSWQFRPDGAAWRRVVPSPEPQAIEEIQPITWLLERGAVVICAGGGGIPCMYPSSDQGALVGVEGVIDKDLASELLAEDVAADLFIMATDVDGVYTGWGTPEQRRLDEITPVDETHTPSPVSPEPGPAQAAAAEAAPAEKKYLSVRQAAFIGVGAMVGAGIFALLGAAGAAVWLSFLIAGVIAGLQGYSFAKLGARYPTAGGLLEYVAKGFGDGHFTGITAWLTYSANAIVTAMVAVSFGSYATSMITGGENAAWVKVFAAVIIIVMTGVNIVGSQLVARAQTLIVYVVLGILSVFAVVTLANMTPHLLAPSGYPPFNDIIASVALTFFAFLGFGIITFTAKDLHQPSRQLPRAMYLALGSPRLSMSRSRWACSAH